MLKRWFSLFHSVFSHSQRVANVCTVTSILSICDWCREAVCACFVQLSGLFACFGPHLELKGEMQIHADAVTFFDKLIIWQAQQRKSIMLRVSLWLCWQKYGLMTNMAFQMTKFTLLFFGFVTNPTWGSPCDPPRSSCWNAFVDHTVSPLLLATRFHGAGQRHGGLDEGKGWPHAVRPMAFCWAGANWAEQTTDILAWSMGGGFVWNGWGLGGQCDRVNYGGVGEEKGEVNQGWKVGPVGGKSWRGSRGPIGDGGEH